MIPIYTFWNLIPIFIGYGNLRTESKNRKSDSYFLEKIVNSDNCIKNGIYKQKNNFFYAQNIMIVGIMWGYLVNKKP